MASTCHEHSSSSWPSNSFPIPKGCGRLPAPPNRPMGPMGLKAWPSEFCRPDDPCLLMGPCSWKNIVNAGQYAELGDVECRGASWLVVGVSHQRRFHRPHRPHRPHHLLHATTLLEWTRSLQRPDKLGAKQGTAHGAPSPRSALVVFTPE